MDKRLIAYFGHHKCASTWIDTIIRGVLTEHGYLYRPVVDHQTPTAHGLLTDYTSRFGRSDVGRHMRALGVDVVGAFTADWSQVEALAPVRGVHVIRDPRDIIVSGYFSHRNSHPVDHLPHMEAHRERLKAASKEEGLLLEMEYAASEMHDLAGWEYDHPNILELKMEEFTARPYEGFLHVFRFWGLLDEDGGLDLSRRLKHLLGVLRNRAALAIHGVGGLRYRMPIEAGHLLGHVFEQRFEKKAGGRVRGQSNASSHYRKGVAGDWANHFTDEHVGAFKEMFGDLVPRLGYAPDNRWAVPKPNEEVLNG